MDTENSDLDYVERIDEAVAAAYRGLLSDYYHLLGQKIAHELGIWTDPRDVDDVISEIKYARRCVDALVEKDVNRKRHGEY